MILVRVFILKAFIHASLALNRWLRYRNYLPWFFGVLHWDQVDSRGLFINKRCLLGLIECEQMLCRLSNLQLMLYLLCNWWLRHLAHIVDAFEIIGEFTLGNGNWAIRGSWQLDLGSWYDLLFWCSFRDSIFQGHSSYLKLLYSFITHYRAIVLVTMRVVLF